MMQGWRIRTSATCRFARVCAAACLCVPWDAYAQRSAAVVAPSAIAVSGDAITAPLTSATPDPDRGRAIVVDRGNGNCLICHKLPAPSEPFQGTIGPDLAGIGRRLTAAQIRLRLADQSRLNPATLMPPFYRTQDLVRVDSRYAGRPVLTALEIEDVVAYLGTLKE